MTKGGRGRRTGEVRLSSPESSEESSSGGGGGGCDLPPVLASCERGE